MKKVLLLLLILTVFTNRLFAQGDGVAMADQLRADGKIWVVVTVVAVVFAGITAYLFKIDSKIGKIEKELNIK
jgi:CcmD family protein